jgi:glyoxylate/hydroxypyruvate reductase A
VLVSVLPQTAETEGLVDAAALARLEPGAFVVNAGRGGAIVDADLIAALDSGRLSGAALDVFRQEPLPADHPFWGHPGVRLSPHVAAPTHPRTAVAVMAESVRRWERGEPLDHLADRARGY